MVWKVLALFVQLVFLLWCQRENFNSRVDISHDISSIRSALSSSSIEVMPLWVARVTRGGWRTEFGLLL